MIDFTKKYLSHMNPYTGVALKDEPALMGLLITNENDLTYRFRSDVAGQEQPATQPRFSGIRGRFLRRQ
jgi:hypothetical protein